MGTVSLFEVACTSDVLLGRDFRGFYVVDHICLDAFAFEGTLLPFALGAVTGSVYRCCHLGLHDFLIVRLDCRFNVFGTTVR